MTKLQALLFLVAAGALSGCAGDTGKRVAGGAFMGGFLGAPAGPIGVAVGAGAGAAAGALIPESVLANN